MFIVYQISSKSGDKWPTYRVSSIFMMAAAAAIMQYRHTLQVFFWYLHVFLSLCTKFPQHPSMKGWFTQLR
jgi:ABC-type uncharacterized transport system permease subunit